MKSLPEKDESLWLLIVSPTIWAGHFLLCYATAAIWCAKFAARFDSLGAVRWLIGGYTVAALIGIAINGFNGLRRYRRGGAGPPDDDDAAADRHRFLGSATALLAGLSAVSVVFAAVVVCYFDDCR